MIARYYSSLWFISDQQVITIDETDYYNTKKFTQLSDILNKTHMYSI